MTPRLTCTFLFQMKGEDGHMLHNENPNQVNMSTLPTKLNFLECSDGKESACNARDPGSIPGSGKSLGDGNGYLPVWLPVFLPGEIHGQEPRKLQSMGRKESDTTKWLHFTLTHQSGEQACPSHVCACSITGSLTGCWGS